MAKSKKQNNLGGSGYINTNCWLAVNVGHPPSKRCEYCQLKFKQCLFSRYLLISLILVFFAVLTSYMVEGTVSRAFVASIFVIMLTYGYYFNSSTEHIIISSFKEKKAKEAFQELSDTLQQRVDDQTKDLREQTEHLQKLLEMRSEFLDIASHQLKTPVSVILGTASMFHEGSMDKLPPEQRAKFMDNIFYKAKKLSVIINDILRASEMDTDVFTLSEATTKPIHVEDIVAVVYDDLKLLAEEKHIEFTVEKPAQPVSLIKTSADLLAHAIYNLVDNAIKYTAKGYVKISISEEKGRVLIKVQDTGIGIPVDDRKKIFEKFTRGKNAVNLYADGSGLGMFIVKKIVSAHKGGKISFESEEGTGTVFAVSFPALKTKEAAK